MTTICAVARVGDPMSHSFAGVGAFFGLAIGIGGGIITGVLLAETGIFAIQAGLNVAMLGITVGEMIGSQYSCPSGSILSGAESVFAGPERTEHARLEDPIQCVDTPLITTQIAIMTSGIPPAAQAAALVAMRLMFGDGAHKGKVLNRGSSSVSVELRQAVRVSDTSDCEAKVEKGCSTVLEGGDPVVLEGGSSSEVPAVIGYIYVAMDWADTILGLFSASKSLKDAAKKGTTGFALTMKKVGVVSSRAAVVLKATRDGLKLAGYDNGALVPDGIDKTGKSIESSINIVLTADKKNVGKYILQGVKNTQYGGKLGKAASKPASPKTVPRTK